MTQQTTCSQCQTVYDSSIFLPGQSFYCVHCDAELHVSKGSGTFMEAPMSKGTDTQAQQAIQEFEDFPFEEEIPTLVSFSLDDLEGIGVDGELLTMKQLPGFSSSDMLDMQSKPIDFEEESEPNDRIWDQTTPEVKAAPSEPRLVAQSFANDVSQNDPSPISRTDSSSFEQVASSSFEQVASSSFEQVASSGVLTFERPAFSTPDNLSERGTIPLSKDRLARLAKPEGQKILPPTPDFSFDEEDTEALECASQTAGDDRISEGDTEDITSTPSSPSLQQVHSASLIKPNGKKIEELPIVIGEESEFEEVSKYQKEHFEPAGFWLRLMAFSIDFILVYGAIAGSFKLLYDYLKTSPHSVLFAQQLPLVFQRFISTLVLLFGALFLLLFFHFFYYGTLYKRGGASIGKRLLRLRVRHIHTGQNIGYMQTFLREVIGKFLSGLFLLVGFLIVGFRKDKLALHDLVFATEVIKVPKSSGSASR